MYRERNFTELRLLPEFEINYGDIYSDYLTILSGLVAETHSITKQQDIPNEDVTSFARSLNNIEKVMLKLNNDKDCGNNPWLKVIARDLNKIKRFLEDTFGIIIQSYNGKLIDDYIDDVEVVARTNDIADSPPNRTIVETIEPSVFYHGKPLAVAKVIVYVNDKYIQ